MSRRRIRGGRGWEEGADQMAESRSGSPLVRAFRSALPLLGAQGVVFAAGFVLGAVLLQILPSEDLAHFGRLREALRWVVVLGGAGLATGLLREAREGREERGALLATTWIAAGVATVIVTAIVAFVPPVRSLVFGDPTAEAEFAIFGWKAPLLVVFAGAIAVLHAGGRLGRMGGLESGERGFVLACCVIGALAGGLRGLVIGSLLASVLTALVSIRAVRREIAGTAPRFETRCLARLFRTGWARTCVLLLETLRPIVLLRVMSHHGLAHEETGLLYAGMLFTLPMIAVPERLAQAIYPTMLDAGGEAPDLDRRSWRLLAELAAVAVPLLLLAGAALTFVLPLFKGGEYAGAVPVVWILLPGVAAHGLAAHQGYVILVRRRLPREAVVSGVALAVTGALAWVLAPEWGAVGAAAALSVALVVRAVLITAVASRRVV